MLLVGAVLFAQSFLRAQSEDPGYPAENLLIVDLDLPRDRYPDRAASSAFFREARDRIGRLAGRRRRWRHHGFLHPAQCRPVGDGRRTPGRTGRRRTQARDRGRHAGYFRAAGIELLEGRDFDERDYEPGAPGVFIVSETLARRFWPGESAVGKRLVGGESPPKDGRWSTVVGVVKDMRREGLDVAPILGAFIPAFPRGMDLTIRASTGVDNLIPAVRQEIRAIDPSLPVPPVVSADGHLSERLGGAALRKSGARVSLPRSRCCCRRQASTRCSPTRSRCARGRSASGRPLAPTGRRSSTMILGKGRPADDRWRGAWAWSAQRPPQSDAKPAL